MRFAVHWPGFPVASPRSHGVPRRDVPGRIHVSVAGETASSTHEPRLALTRLRIHMPARGASLAGERRSDLLYPAGRLVLQSAHQQSPARPQDLPIEARLRADALARSLSVQPGRACHVSDLQVLDPDEVEPTGKIRSGFLDPVLSPVGLAGSHPGGSLLHPDAASRSPFSAGELMLQPTHASALIYGQTGSSEEFSGRQGRRHHHPAVNTYGFAIAQRENRIGDHGECQMPAACAVQRHPIRFRPCWYRAGPAESHPSGLRHPDLADSAAQPPNLLWPYCDASKPLISTGLAPRRLPGRVLRVEERSQRIGEVPQCLLLNNARARSQPRVLRPRLCELSALCQVVRRALPAGVPVRVLFDCEVPHVSGVSAMVPQHRFLGRRGEQSIPGHANTLATITDISGEVKRRFRPDLSNRVPMPKSS